MRFIAASAVVLATLAGAPALAQSAGEWETTATSPQGTFTSTWTLTDGEPDAIAVVDPAPPGGGPAMESTFSEVVVDGANFSFKRQLTTPGGPIELTYTGTVDGDALTATAAGNFGGAPFEMPITGTRKQ